MQPGPLTPIVLPSKYAEATEVSIPVDHTSTVGILTLTAENEVCGSLNVRLQIYLCAEIGVQSVLPSC